MKTHCLIFTCILFANSSLSQIFNKEKNCGTDTIKLNYTDRKTGERVNYKAFRCSQAAPAGGRVDVGRSHFGYNSNTKAWLGNHNSTLLGGALFYHKINIGVRLKFTTVNPKSQLLFKGDTLVQAAKLNPQKIDFYTGYSLDLKHNFSFEPYVGVTRNLFYVINEKDLNKTYRINKVYGLNAGLTLNKYFKMRDYQFLALYVSYGHGFTDFRKVNSALGKGYSEWTIGAAYKFFYIKRFYHKIL